MKKVFHINFHNFFYIIASSPLKKIVCYLSSWSKFRPGDGAFHVDKIDPFLCTHIVYTFAGLDINGNIVSLDPDNDIRDSK